MEWNIKSMLSDLNVDYTFEGPEKKIKSVSSLAEATEDDVSFSYDEGEKAASNIAASNAGVILCNKKMKGIIYPKSSQLVIYLDNPRLVLERILNLMYRKKKIVGISPHATISDESKIGNNCYIGDYTLIGDNCKIGDNTIIYGRVTILQNCVIGNDCI